MWVGSNHEILVNSRVNPHDLIPYAERLKSTWAISPIEGRVALVNRLLVHEQKKTMKKRKLSDTNIEGGPIDKRQRTVDLKYCTNSSSKQITPHVFALSPQDIPPSWTEAEVIVSMATTTTYTPEDDIFLLITEMGKSFIDPAKLHLLKVNTITNKIDRYDINTPEAQARLLRPHDIEIFKIFRISPNEEKDVNVLIFAERLYTTKMRRSLTNLGSHVCHDVEFDVGMWHVPPSINNETFEKASYMKMFTVDVSKGDTIAFVAHTKYNSPVRLITSQDDTRKTRFHYSLVTISGTNPCVRSVHVVPSDENVQKILCEEHKEIQPGSLGYMITSDGRKLVSVLCYTYKDSPSLQSSTRWGACVMVANLPDQFAETMSTMNGEELRSAAIVNKDYALPDKGVVITDRSMYCEPFPCPPPRCASSDCIELRSVLADDGSHDCVLCIFAEYVTNPNLVPGITDPLIKRFYNAIHIVRFCITGEKMMPIEHFYVETSSLGVSSMGERYHFGIISNFNIVRTSPRRFSVHPEEVYVVSDKSMARGKRRSTHDEIWGNSVTNPFISFVVPEYKASLFPVCNQTKIKTESVARKYFCDCRIIFCE